VAQKGLVLMSSTRKRIVSPFEEDTIRHYSASRMFTSVIAIGLRGVSA
jgi:hypothetical protein